MAILTCSGCGARNRVDERAETLTPVCGRCGALLEAGAGVPVVVTDATFPTVVLGAGAVPVLVDCWAPWCGPCQALAPTLDRLAAEAGGRYLVAKLDIDQNPRTAQQFGIQSIPTLLIFKNGALVDRLVGAQPKQSIQARLAMHVG